MIHNGTLIYTNIELQLSQKTFTRHEKSSCCVKANRCVNSLRISVLSLLKFIFSIKRNNQYFLKQLCIIYSPY